MKKNNNVPKSIFSLIVVLFLLGDSLVIADNESLTGETIDASSYQLGSFGAISEITSIAVKQSSQSLSLLLTIDHNQSSDVIVTTSSARITWRTDQPASGQIMYGLSQDSLNSTRSESATSLNHSLSITSLRERTSYFYRINSTTPNESAAAAGSFLTRDGEPPARVEGLTTTFVSYSRVAIAWNAVPDNDIAYYMIYRSGDQIANTSGLSYEDNTVRPSTQYTYTVKAVDTSGNPGRSSLAYVVTTESAPFDVVPPQISHILVNQTDTSARITWQTDENATSQIFYGVNASVLNLRKQSLEQSLDHTMLLSNLVNGTAYYYVVQGCDARNNCENSTNRQFETAARDTFPPFIEMHLPAFAAVSPLPVTIATEPSSILSIKVNNGSDIVATANNEGLVAASIPLQQGQNTIIITARDRLGNNASQRFSTIYDSVIPELFVNKIDSVLLEDEIVVEGVVNKNMSVQVIVIEGGSNNVAPPKITGLQVEEVGLNYLDISWQESKVADLDEYIIYLNETPIKGVTRNRDRLSALNTNTSYEIRVAAIDKSCNLGQKSDPLKARTNASGIALNIEVNPYNYSCRNRESVEAQGVFGKGPFKMNLSLEDGNNTIIIRASDIANRTVEKRIDTFVDTKPPEIRDITPRSGTNIFEVHANSVTIRGKTEPYAKVKLFAVRGTLTAQTRDDGDAENIVLTQVDEEKKADEDGNFVFDKVNLARYVNSGIREVRAGSESDPTRYDDITRTDEVNLLLAAEDQAGKKANITVNYRIGICFSGDLAYNIVPLPQYQSPSLMSPERLSEGTEEISFVFNLSAMGSVKLPEQTNTQNDLSSGRSLSVQRVTVQVAAACDRYIKEQKKYNWSCKALRGCRAVANPQGTLFYVTCALSRLNELDNFTKDAWKNFFKSLNNEMRFPLKVSISYRALDENGRSTTKTQTSCEEVSYVLDNARIDPRDVLPDWLLDNGVDFLNKSIDAITKINDKLNQVIRITSFACMGGVLVKMAASAKRIWSCKSEQITAKAGKIVESTGISVIDKERKDNCRLCMEQYISYANNQGLTSSLQTFMGKLGNETAGLLYDDQKNIPDQCMQFCFPNCAAAWKSEESAYKVYRFACDRVFCHTAPSRWTENKSSEELFPNMSRSSQDGCKTNTNVKGRALMAEKCNKFVEEKGYTPSRSFGEDEYCVKLRQSSGAYQILGINKNPVSGAGNLFELEGIQLESGPPTKYAIKVAENYYLTSQDEKCNEICDAKNKRQAASAPLLNFNIDDSQSKDVANIQLRDKQTAFGICTKTVDCYELNNKENKQLRASLAAIVKGFKGGQAVDVKSASPAGYSSDCFYKAQGQEWFTEQYVTDDVNTQAQCCCINSQPAVETKYFNETDPFIEKRDSQISQQTMTPEQIPQLFSPQNRPTSPADMEFSYRYQRINFSGKNYNPYRYIQERDQPACFGQNNWLYDAGVGDGQGKLLMLDPFRQHTSALQCGCLTGIYNRLRMVQNILTYSKTCLEEVKKTGRADSGTCKEIFTHYVCGLIWDAISFVRDGCSSVFSGVDAEADEDSISQNLKKGLDSVFGAVDENMKELSSEYGNAKIDNLLGAGEGAVARKMCLAAFGFDWELDVDSVMDAAYSTPFQTLVSSITRSRDFIGVNVRSQEAKYEYRASWMINPGCDIDSYDVSLACVNRADLAKHKDINCDKVNDPKGYDCDCMNAQQSNERLFFRGRTLKSNILADEDYHDIISAPYRYDHLKFTLRPSRRIVRNNPQAAEKCFPTGHEDGVFYFPLHDTSAQDIVDCQVDVLSGQFICGGQGSLLWDSRGLAYMRDIKLNGKTNREPVFVQQNNDSLYFSASVFNDGKAKCLSLKVKKANGEEKNEMKVIDFNGSFDFDIPLMNPEDIKLTGGGGVSSLQRETECSLRTPTTDAINVCHTILNNAFRSRKPSFSLTGPATDKRVDFSITFIISNNNLKLQLDRGISLDPSTPLTKDGVSILLDQSSVDDLLHNADLIERIDNFTLQYTVYPKSQVSQSETWELNYGLYYMDEEETRCLSEDLPVTYQDNAQSGSFRFTVGTAQDAARLKHTCLGDGFTAAAIPCDCDGYGTGEEIGIDCLEDRETKKVYKYCYEPVTVPPLGYKRCFTQPKCQQNGAKLIDGATNCDCNGDGQITSSDCDKAAGRLYCFSGICVNNPKKCSVDGNQAQDSPCDCNDDKKLDDKDCDVSTRKYCFQKAGEPEPLCHEQTQTAANAAPTTNAATSPPATPSAPSPAQTSPTPTRVNSLIT